MDISKIGTERIHNDQQNNSVDKAKNQKQAEQSANTQENRSSESVGQSQSARVTWSSEAQMAAAADKAARNAPDVRADRVAALKAAIADGSYKVDSKSLADKMIDSALKDDLLTRNG